MADSRKVRGCEPGRGLETRPLLASARPADSGQQVGIELAGFDSTVRGPVADICRVLCTRAAVIADVCKVHCIGVPLVSRHNHPAGVWRGARCIGGLWLRALGYVQRFRVGLAIARAALAENGNPPLKHKVTPSFIYLTLRKAPVPAISETLMHAEFDAERRSDALVETICQRYDSKAAAFNS